MRGQARSLSQNLQLIIDRCPRNCLYCYFIDTLFLTDSLHISLSQALGFFSTNLRHLLTQGSLKKIEVECSSQLSANAEEIDSLPNNTWSLWCPLFVVLLRTVASQEELVGQGRIASRSVLEYADVLLCHGHYQSAFASYSRATSGLMDISSDSEIQIEKPWTDLKRITLLKSLYCSVAQGNRV